MFRGHFYSQQEQGFPWEQQEQAGYRGDHGHHRGHGHHGFEGRRGPWGFGYGRPGIAPEQQVLWSTAAEVARLFTIAARSTIGNAEQQGRSPFPPGAFTYRVT